MPIHSECIASGIDKQVHLLGRQHEAGLDGVERGRPLRIELIEGDAADRELDVAAVPVGRHAVTVAIFVGKLAPPVDERLLPVADRTLKCGIAADRP